MAPTLPTDTAQQKFLALREHITGDELHYGNLFQALRDMHALFVELGALDSNGTPTQGTHLAKGYAISPIGAGKCLFEIARTRAFSRGLINALKEKLAASPGRPLKILYAGCGPYALLALLAAPAFAPGEISFTAIDLHEEAVQSAKVLTGALGYADYFSAITCIEASAYAADCTIQFDVLLLETMLSALQKEPQVALTALLLPLLAPDGILVPEKITVTPVFTEMNIRQANMLMQDTSGFTMPEKYAHEPVAVLAKDIPLADNPKLPFPIQEVKLNDAYLRSNYVLELCTTVKVWGEEVVKDFDSSITLPLKIAEGGKLSGKEAIRFRFLHVAEPHWEWELIE